MLTYLEVAAHDDATCDEDVVVREDREFGFNVDGSARVVVVSMLHERWRSYYVESLSCRWEKRFKIIRVCLIVFEFLFRAGTFVSVFPTSSLCHLTINQSEGKLTQFRFKLLTDCFVG